MDWRIFTLLYDHKFLMLERIIYLKDSGAVFIEKNIICSYEQLLELAKASKNIYIKYTITHDKDLLVKIIGLLKLMRKLEESLLEELYNMI